LHKETTMYMVTTSQYSFRSDNLNNQLKNIRTTILGVAFAKKA